MQWPTIQQRIQDGESGRVEFKRGLGDLSAIGLAICAFANTDGGVVILGIESSGEIVGVKEGTERVCFVTSKC